MLGYGTILSHEREKCVKGKISKAIIMDSTGDIRPHNWGQFSNRTRKCMKTTHMKAIQEGLNKTTQIIKETDFPELQNISN